MSITKQLFVVTALAVAAPALSVAAEKDCLLKGTVVHGEQAGQEATMVKIHSVSRYDEEARCRVRDGRKMEFKLPSDQRVQEAPSGSEVHYRYRTDGQGDDSAELIHVGA
tara:strand:+ start:1568 stop:1897 length:330 start_codon:yes stop_codon:yes gene_type:complete